MRARDIFKKVRTHMLAQGKRALAEGSSQDCRYRTLDGLKCAVGCLVLDEHYNPDAEGYGLSTVITKGNRTWQSASGIGGHGLAVMLNAAKIPATRKIHDMLMDLQRIHDTVDPDNWDVYLKRLHNQHFPRKAKV